MFFGLARDLLAPLWELLLSALPAMSTSFFSVLVGALPFIVVAAFASAILEVYVPPDLIARLVPRNPLLGILLAPLFGLIFPMCECGVVPVARRMIQKGVPGATAITFMLANPILNPLAIYATFLAFPLAHSMVYWRVGLGYLVAVVIGLVVQAFGKGRAESDYLLHPSYGASVACAADCGSDHDDHAHAHHHATAGSRLRDCLNHATTEFFDVLKYFIIGSGIAAISQALIDRQTLEWVGGGPVSSVLIMIGFAYVICICSEADAFVAASFASTFMPGALLGFLVAGPMTDIKNTMMMKSAFRSSFVLLLNALIIGITAILAIGLNLWIGGR